MTSESRIVPRFIRNLPMVPSRHYQHFQSLWQAHSQTMTYKELQMMARMSNIPCNLKKSLLILLIDARLNGREEEVRLLLNHDKLEKLKRKKQKENQRRFKSETMSQNLQMEGNPDRAPARHVKVEKILHKMLHETSARNVTICHTRTSTEYRSFEEAATSSSTSTPQNYMNSRADHYHSDFINNCQGSIPQGDSTPTKVMTDHNLDKILCETHSPQAKRQSLSHSTFFPGSCSLDPPLYGVRNQHYCSYLGDFVNDAPTTGFNEFLLPRNNNRPQTTDMAGSFEALNTDHGFSDYGNNHYQQQLPPFNTFKKNLPAVDSALKLEPLSNPSSIGLMCLADTAMSVEKDSNYRSFNFKLEQNTDSHETSHENDPNPDDSQCEEKDVPTWLNYLERVQCKVISRGVTCKYGCHVLLKTRIDQLNHESECRVQPVPCPLVSCKWFNQLGSLTTHIFSEHDMEVIRSPNANFFVDLCKEVYNPIHSSPSCSLPGPKRITFLQMVDQRLFVIYVIGNLHLMQVMIYIQYVDDFANWTSVATLEVVRLDGTPYQVKNIVYPLTYPSHHLISRRKCLVFNLDAEHFSANNFTLHTTIHRLGIGL